MALLTIDIGNTSTAAAVFAEDAIVYREKLSTPQKMDGAFLSRLVPLHLAHNIDRAVFSSVVPRLDEDMAQWLRQRFQAEALRISHRIQSPLHLKVETPDEIGADRLADAAGAIALYRPPLIVIDSGTATTFELVNEKLDYLGGCIFPGIETALDSLAEHTAKLTHIPFEIPVSPIGTNTPSSMCAGVYYAYLGGLERLIGEYKAILGAHALVIATGGLCALFHGQVRGIDRVEPDLIFHGMKFLYEQNR